MRYPGSTREGFWRTGMRVAAIVLVGALGLAGCAPDYVTQDESDVIFRIVDINLGAPLSSDVSDEGVVLADTVPVVLAVRFKNPQLTTPSVPNAVVFERYEVRYFRTDGRGVEGQDVPYRITGGMNTTADVGTGGGDNVTVAMEVVRAQAKLEPPLRNLREPGGSALVLTVMADITIHGRTITGKTVESTGRLQIDFADYSN